MAILKIARMGHPVLTRPADLVTDPTAPEIADLIDDMADTLDDADGAGLAAPQVHVPLRLVLVGIPAERLAKEGEEGEAEPEPLIPLINPVLTPLSEEKESGWEACLSLPDLAGYVPRFTHIQCRYQTLTGDTVEREAKGFFARVLQHECDHLDGILYPMRIDDLSRFGFVREMQKARRASETTAEDEAESEEAEDD